MDAVEADLQMLKTLLNETSEKKLKESRTSIKQFQGKAKSHTGQTLKQMN